MPILTAYDHRHAKALVATTLFLLVFGSTVRVHGAGLACPDWPLCFGEVVPAYDFEVYLEFGHRVVAGVVSLWFVAQSAILWRRGELTSGLLRLLVPLAAVVLAAQVVLGGLTVLELLAEWTVASHLLVGNTFCALLLLTALAMSPQGDAPAIDGWARIGPVLLLLLVPTQVVLGGLVAGTESGLACGTWPSCNGAGWFPTLSGYVGLQVVHRITAYTLLVVGLGTAALSWRVERLRGPSAVLGGVLLIQAGIGIANVLLRLPMEVTLLHSLGAACAMLSMTWLNHEAWRAPIRSTASVAMGRPMEAK